MEAPSPSRGRDAFTSPERAHAQTNQSRKVSAHGRLEHTPKTAAHLVVPKKEDACFAEGECTLFTS